MFFYGILIIISGFLFIFSPGIPYALLSKKVTTNRDLLFWGIGIWIVSFILTTFLFNFFKQVAAVSRPSVPDAWQVTLLNSALLGLITLGAVAFFLRRRKNESDQVLTNGLALGYGMGMISQVFLGLTFIGMGLPLIFGDISDPNIAMIAEMNFGTLLLNLLAIILYRPALLVVGAVQGVLVGRSLKDGAGYFLLAVLVNVVFGWFIVLFNLGVGNPTAQVEIRNPNPLFAIITIGYYSIAFILAYKWLEKQVASWGAVKFAKRR